MKRIGHFEARFDAMGRGFSQEFESSLGEAMRLTDVRWEKVAALRNAIAKGTYKVSSEAIAEKMMASMLSRAN